MTRLEEVLEDLEAGYYLVPEIQRGFVWRNPQIREFMASIYNEDPVGSIVYWDPPPSVLRDESLCDIFKPLADGLPENGKFLVIDGQQRLTSLLLVKKGELSIRGIRRKIELYFNPIEEKFELKSKKVLEDAAWFNVTEVLNTDDIQEVVERHAERDPSLTGNPYVRKNLSHFREIMKTYDLPSIRAKLSPTEDFLSTLERMARIFINLNSTGTRVKMPDLALALLTAKTRKEVGVSFRETFEYLLKDTEEMGFTLDETVVIRAYSAIATGTTRFKEAREALDKEEGNTILDFLNETEKSVGAAIDLLRELGIKSGKYLQSRYLVVPLAYLLHCEVLSKGRMISTEMRSDICRWLILASGEKRYTGRLETDLLSDVQQIKNGNGVNGLQSNLAWREIPLSALQGDYENYHLTILLLLYKRLESRDWNLTETPSPKRISEMSSEQLSIHHIFPEEFLERRGLQQNYDLFGNVTIISYDANRRLKYRNPKDYLKELNYMAPELLTKHCIPPDEGLWDVNRYEDFVKERAKLIAGKVEQEFGIRVLT